MHSLADWVETSRSGSVLTLDLVVFYQNRSPGHTQLSVEHRLLTRNQTLRERWRLHSVDWAEACVNIGSGLSLTVQWLDHPETLPGQSLNINNYQNQCEQSCPSIKVTTKKMKEPCKTFPLHIFLDKCCIPGYLSV